MIGCPQTEVQVLLQFNRGTSDPDGDGNYDCIPAVDNFQVSSGENSVWFAEQDLFAILMIFVAISFNVFS